MIVRQLNMYHVVLLQSHRLTFYDQELTSSYFTPNSNIYVIATFSSPTVVCETVADGNQLSERLQVVS